ncbi:response regulator [soil metagenome]
MPLDDDFHILLIEDSPTDVLIIRRALAEVQVPHRLTVIADGTEALDYLARLGQPEGNPEPHLILLDLNLPGLDGAEVLGRIKSEPTLRALPVVVLTTSNRDEDIWQTYQAGANTYIQKPADYASYRQLVGTLRTYWHQTALRPNRPRPMG